jgi:hypothetical protein
LERSPNAQIDDAGYGFPDGAEQRDDPRHDSTRREIVKPIVLRSPRSRSEV